MKVSNTSTPVGKERFSAGHLENCKILLVEDIRTNVLLLERILASRGFNNVMAAMDGFRGLELLETFQPDIIILDIMMPKMDGFEFCRRVRQDKRYQNVPILVQTALTERKQKMEVFHVGATDYVAKPIDAEELIAKVKVHLERQKLFKEVLESRKRMEHELAEASNMQGFLMPRPEQIAEIETSYGISIESFFRSSSEVGGDIWGVRKISDQALAVYITDFSGHGVIAAFNTFRLHTLIQGCRDVAMFPDQCLARLNQSLVNLLPVGQFATMFYGVINMENNTLSYAAAAATDPVLMRGQDNFSYEFLKGKGFPLGVKRDATFDVHVQPFGPGDTLFLYSDALVETLNNQGSCLDAAHIAQEMSINRRQGMSDKDAFQALINLFLTDYLPNLQDDLTLNCYCWRP